MHSIVYDIISKNVDDEGCWRDDVGYYLDSLEIWLLKQFGIRGENEKEYSLVADCISAAREYIRGNIIDYNSMESPLPSTPLMIRYH